MMLVAVTLNWKDTESTLRCVESLLESEEVSQIIVVDNESDGSLAKQLIHLDRVSIIEMRGNLGFAGGMNIAISEAIRIGATRVLSINNDATIDCKSIALLSESVATHKYGLVAPTVLNADGSVQSQGEFISKIGRTSQSQSAFTLAPFLSWACVMVTSETFSKVGMLDSRFFMYYEDVDFSLRVRSAGIKYGVEKSATAIHALNKSHSKAGIRIQMYSTAALISFGKKWKQDIPLMITLGRVLVRVFRQYRNWRNMLLILKACKIGWLVQSESHVAFDSIAVRKHQGR